MSILLGMKAFLLCLFGAIAISQAVLGTEIQTNSFPVVRLWEQDAPGALGTGSNDIPTLTVYLPGPEVATGAAIVVCPGGGYGSLASCWF